jgi:multidrug efflux system membrane fusion protein
MNVFLTRRNIILGLLVITFIGYTVKRLMFNPMSLLAAYQPPPVTVQAITLKEEPLEVFLEALGGLQAHLEVTLAPEISGRIQEISYASGAFVKKGDVLIALDDQVEAADLKKSQAALALAKVNLDRAQNLITKKVETQANVDQRTADYNQALAVVAQNQTRLDQKKIRASFEGQLGIFDPKINLGHYIQPGQPIVTLTNRKKLYINFTLPEQDRPQVAQGQKILITVDAYPDRTYEGKITSIDPQIKDQTRTISLQGTLENTDLSLFPGMYARIKIAVQHKNKALLVPETALNYTLYGHSVFVVEPQKEGPPIVRRQSVKIGQKHLDKVEILDALKAGDIIVSVGELKLDTGMPVTLSNEQGIPQPKTLKH